MKVFLGKPKYCYDCNWFKFWLIESIGVKPAIATKLCYPLDVFCGLLNRHITPTEQRQLIIVDKYDVWGMDKTLAKIILPMLKKMKEYGNGSPLVDNADVPRYLRDENYDLIHEKWEYVIDEMIWAFTELNSEWEDQYHTGEHDIQFVPIAGSSNKRMVRGPNHTAVFDSVGYEKHLSRMENAFRLFGKYYMKLGT